ncbi:AAA family ATPase [Flavobacteriaceae bacterium XHP0103]|uniref:ATP-dependent nuclease n=1 Tax=Marixanthotalea marina TaxID=2844359 RepID=UPI002989C1CF|nr:AAA family ATPase [Marixanthotalea marina]MBU3821509.1 AAA family ATPase [Marixanthotalea marina]
MDIISVRIENYRAIEDINVLLNYPINPIIGINESGKTSILKAILCLDKGRDKFNKGQHLEYQNKYSTRDTVGCRITASIKLTEQEIEELISYCQFNTGTEDYEQLLSISNTSKIQYARTLSEDKTFSILNEEFSNRLKSKLLKFIQNRFPVFLYFDDFTDRVPEEITFNETYINDGKLGRGIQREWQEIIEEILKRSELEGIDDNDKALQNYFKVENRDRKYDILSDIEAVLNSEIIAEWRKIKKRGKNNFADDSENLKLELDNTEHYKFQFKVRDTSNQNKKRTFNVSERSKGFQWFFNYMIKLKFNPRYTKTQENSIFLLDEPGSYLHSSAQTELLKELKSVSEKNTIIYCTHSQFLLNPDDIKLGSIKIAQKQDSKIELDLFGQYKSEKNSGALSPVYQALQLNSANDYIGDVIITEGITDYYVLKMMQENWNFPKPNTKIIPGSGSGSSTNLISFALGFTNNFKIIFDNDRAGHQASTKYVKEFGETIENYFHFYHESKKNFKLENHFSKKDQDRLLKITNSKSLKRAIPILYLDLNEKIKEFLNDMEEESKNLLGITINSIGL